MPDESGTHIESVPLEGFRFERYWRNKWATANATTLEEMVLLLSADAYALNQMLEDGVILDPDSAIQDDYARLVTNDPKLAEKYGFEKAML